MTHDSLPERFDLPHDDQPAEHAASPANGAEQTPAQDATDTGAPEPEEHAAEAPEEQGAEEPAADPYEGAVPPGYDWPTHGGYLGCLLGLMVACMLGGLLGSFVVGTVSVTPLGGIVGYAWIRITLIIAVFLATLAVLGRVGWILGKRFYREYPQPDTASHSAHAEQEASGADAEAGDSEHIAESSR